ncbi:MAG: HEAT repeat domain-containing protein [Candidatus Wallbacteria bacterium]|nr:HEAT repeat domain-containing protein [Candidatus Wallbacteria bacterium]
MTESESRSPNADQQLKLLLNSEDEAERKQAIVQLSRNPRRENFLILQKISDFDESVEVRFYAKKALNILKSRITPRLTEKETSAIGTAEIGKFIAGNVENEQAVQIIQYIVNNDLKETLPGLITVLNREKDPNIISTLLIAIGKFGSEKEIKIINPFLSHEIPRIRANAIDALELIGSVRAYPLVISKLEDNDNRVRANAVRFVRELGGVNTQKILRAMAGSPGSAMRASAAYAYQFYPAEENVDPLVLLLESSEVTVRNNALKTLSIFKSKGIKKAQRVLKKFEPVAEIKAESMEGVEPETENKAGTWSSLKEELTNPDLGKRLKAITEAVEKGSCGAILSEHLAKEKDVMVIATIIIGLGKLQYKKALPVLVGYLKAEDGRCRANAVEALRLINDKDNLKEIIPLLKDENNRVRANAIFALKREKIPETFTTLLEMVNSEDMLMQLSAIYVIMKLEDPDYYELLIDLGKSRYPEVSKKSRDSIKELEIQGIKVEDNAAAARSNRVFKMFTISTFDLREELNALQSGVYPKLKALCQEHGYRFEVCDLDFGISDGAIDQQTMKSRLEEIKRCQEISPPPYFLILLGDRYGIRQLPAEIPESEFTKIVDKFLLKRKSGDCTDEGLNLLGSWYKRDLNALYQKDQDAKPEFLWILQPRTGEYLDQKVWEKVVQKLCELFKLLTDDFKEDRRLSYNASAASREIIDCALKIRDKQKHLFCFLRKITNLEELIKDLNSADSKARDFIDTKNDIFDQDSHDLSVEVQNQLYKTVPQNIFEYEEKWENGRLTDGQVSKLCADAYQALSSAISAKITPDTEPGSLASEIRNHENFRIDSEMDFTGRTEYLKFIADYLKLKVHQKSPLAIYGKPGSGKSALMAHAIKNELLRISHGVTARQSTVHPRNAMKGDNPNPQIIYRFLGTTPDSSNIRSMLESICRQIAQLYTLDENTIPSDYDGLEKAFPELLKSAVPAKPLIIFLDALDQLSNQDASELRWLPAELPENVRLVVTTLDPSGFESDVKVQAAADADQYLENLKNKIPESNIRELGKMSGSDGKALLDCWLNKANRQLLDWQEKLILKRFKNNGNLFYLKIASLEAERWKSYTTTEEIKLSSDLTGIIRDMFERLSLPSNHGKMIVSSVLGYLAACRNGSAEDELLEILASDEELHQYISQENRYQKILKIQSSDSKKARSEISAAIWKPLYFDLAPYLTGCMAEGTFLIRFSNRQFSQVAKEMFLTESVKKKRHAVLAKYFLSQPHYLEKALESEKHNSVRTVNFRKCTELPYQLRKARMFAESEKNLTDLDFIEAKNRGGMTQDLIQDYDFLGGCKRPDPPVRTAWQHNGILGINCVFCNAWFAIGELELDTVISCRHCGSKIKLNLFIINAKWEPKPPDNDRMIKLKDSNGENTEYDFSSAFHELEDFVRSSALILSKKPECIYQAICKPGNKMLLKPACKLPKSCLMTFFGHTDWAQACGFSPDGKLVVSGSADRTLKIWDAGSGQLLTTLTGHTGGVNSCCFSPDGRRVVSCSDDNTLKIWDVSGQPLFTLTGHTHSVTSCCFSPDGKLVVSSSYDHTLKIWDADSGQQLCTLSGHTGEIDSCCFSPDGKRVVSGSWDHTLKIWNAGSSQEQAALAAHTNVVTSCCFSPDGKRVVSGSYDQTLMIWDADSGQQLATLTGHTSGCKSCEFSPDGKRVVSGSNDNTLKIWDAATFKELATLTGHGSPVNSCRFSPDGNRVISGSSDNTLKIWGAGSS